MIMFMKIRQLLLEAYFFKRGKFFLTPFTKSLFLVSANTYSLYSWFRLSPIETNVPKNRFSFTTTLLAVYISTFKETLHTFHPILF